jgi:hypothetical protein
MIQSDALIPSLQLVRIIDIAICICIEVGCVTVLIDISVRVGITDAVGVTVTTG